VREQLASFKELKSQNEDVESDVAITNLNEANLAFNAALAATGSIIDKTLLDYI
jgi:flagellin-like hook-associated protein FlgL